MPQGLPLREPQRQARLELPERHRLESGPVDLRLVGRVVERQTDDRRHQRRQGEADLRQQEENGVELQHQRCAAEHFDVRRQQRPQPHRTVHSPHGHSQADADGQRERQARQEHRHPGRLEQERQGVAGKFTECLPAGHRYLGGVAEHEHLLPAREIPAIVERFEPAVGDEPTDRRVDRRRQLRRVAGREDRVEAAGEGPIHRPQPAETVGVEVEDAVVHHGGIEHARRHLLQRVDRAVVADHIDLQIGSRPHDALGGRAGEHAHPPPSFGPRRGERVERVQGTVAAGEELQAVGEIGPRAVVVALTVRRQLDPVDHAIGSAAEQQRQAVPLPLLKPGLHPQFFGEDRRQVDLEAGQPSRIGRVGEDVRPAPFLIGGPDQFAAGHHLVEVRSGGRRDQCRNQHAGREHASEELHRESPRRRPRSPPGSVRRATSVSWSRLRRSPCSMNRAVASAAAAKSASSGSVR